MATFTIFEFCEGTKCLEMGLMDRDNFDMQHFQNQLYGVSGEKHYFRLRGYRLYMLHIDSI